jgi:hypothetical protein
MNLNPYLSPYTKINSNRMVDLHAKPDSLKSPEEASVVIHVCNPSIQEAEAKGSQIQGRPLLHNEF